MVVGPGTGMLKIRKPAVSDRSAEPQHAPGDTVWSRHLACFADGKAIVMSAEVLTADDSGTMRKVIIRSSNTIGVTEAADGAEAQSESSQDHFGLLLTDWNIPEKTGLDVSEGTRGRSSDVPILMITSDTEKRRVLDAIRPGVNDYLVKPFEAESLREKVDKLVKTLSAGVPGQTQGVAST